MGDFLALGSLFSRPHIPLDLPGRPATTPESVAHVYIRIIHGARCLDTVSLFIQNA